MTRGTVLYVEGTGANPNAGPNDLHLLGTVRERLSPLWRSINVPYPATYGNPDSYEASVRQGERNLVDAIRRDPFPVALVGFSQGATIVGNVARDIAAGKHPDLDVRGVALIADPMRPAGKSDGNQAPGYGIGGERLIPTNRFLVWWFAHPTDAITCADHDSLLRSVADVTRHMGLADPRGWANDVAATLAARSWQNAWAADRLLDIPYQANRVRRARNEIRGYLPRTAENPQGGQHLVYGWQPVWPGGPTYSALAAERLNRIGFAL